MVGSVLVADTELATRSLLRDALTYDGYHVEVAAEPAEALAYANEFDVVIADIRFNLLPAFKLRAPSTEVVLVTCAKTLDEAVAAVRRGAFDFIVRPFYIEDISLTVASAAARRQRLGLGSPLSHVGTIHELHHR